MSFTPLQFTKKWTDPIAFPTHEIHEDKVRSDMQCLYDEIADHFNKFLNNELLATNIPFSPTVGEIESTNIQNAIEFVYASLQGITLGQIPDGSITTVKLATDAVTRAKILDGEIVEDKIANGAVTEDKIENNAVTADKIKDGEVVDGKLASLSVGTSNIKNFAVEENKLASNAVTNGKIKNGEISWDKFSDQLKSSVQKQHKKITVTLASGASTWTVQATGVTAACDLFLGPKTDDVTYGDTYFDQWSNCGIRCISQGDGTLTFKSRSATTASVVVNVLIFE